MKMLQTLTGFVFLVLTIEGHSSKACWQHPNVVEQDQTKLEKMRD
jgi:hypothetical protein